MRVHERELLETANLLAALLPLRDKWAPGSAVAKACDFLAARLEEQCRGLLDDKP